jgi:hypothetical protein
LKLSQFDLGIRRIQWQLAASSSEFGESKVSWICKNLAKIGTDL